MGTMTRVFEFDSAHRVMNEKFKCYNLHGHRFKVEVTFNYKDTSKLGYAIDFKEVKRVCGDFIDEFLDHGCLLNPKDLALITMCKVNNWKLWIMGLGNDGDINPSAENIAAELTTIFNQFFTLEKQGVAISSVRLYETPNCWVTVNSPLAATMTADFKSQVDRWRQAKGDICYDTREE